MTSLRQTIESDLASTLEGEFASVDAQGVGLVELIAPDGTRNTGLKALVLRDRRRVNPETGETVVVPETVIVLRRSTLARVPAAGERWHVRFPGNASGSVMLSGLIGPDRAPEGGETIGFVRLYPHDVSAHNPDVSGLGGIASAAAVGEPVVTVV